ncbi:hypothetical protein PMAYCL1PPCAC_10130 [Pristionchus mayeri]|uniref:F-box domain-containing protein n=1 Tax=Pristionchus mayeri TaxID=1317129 RepID=A0AAN5CCQ9_9BILA|nr:hypothetical protein PMAYCL1PPCAC_10130 [Pristionchus mayeri]
MENGDQPTCSKYWRESKKDLESDQEQENGLSEASLEGDLEPSPWQTAFPLTIIREIGDMLQISEVKNLRLVCRRWTSCLDASLLLKARRFAVNATAYQWEPIHYSHALYAPRIFPRMFHCGAHHPLTDKVYMFGGNGLQRHVDNYDFDAHFNDLWTFDLRVKRWDRLLVPGTPYPTPKSRSSLIAWREYLVLFGGFRRPNGRRVGIGAAEFPDRSDESEEDPSFIDMSGPARGSLPHEIHYLNVKKNVWETATPVPREGGLNFLGLHDHTAAVFGKWMIVAGGLRSTPWEESVFVNTHIFLFDLEERTWSRVRLLPPEIVDEKPNAPSVAELARGTLALIRPGRLLFHPAFPIRYPPAPPPPGIPAPIWQPPAQLLPIQALLHRSRDSLRCYFLDFDAENVLEGNWQWRPVEVVSPHILRPTGPLSAPVVVTSDNRVRLVCVVPDTRRIRCDADFDVYNGLQCLSSTVKREINIRLAQKTPAEFYESLTDSPFEFELDCFDLYKRVDYRALKESLRIRSGSNSLKLIVSVLQGRSGHIGDYKIRILPMDSRYAHIFTCGVTNFIEETTVGSLPTKGGGRSPHFASTNKTLQMVRQSTTKRVKLIQADLTALNESDALPNPHRRLVWEEVAERPSHEEHPVASHGLLLAQADGAILVTGGESRPDEEGVIDTSIGGGTWMANPVK